MRQDAAAVTRWATVCAQTDGALDCRCAAHCTRGASSALCAAPLWLAVYRGDREIVQVLLKAHASPDTTSRACLGGGRSCDIGGQSALHLAVARGACEIVQRLVSLKAHPDLPFCFALLSEEDEPEWNEAADRFEGGLAGLSVLQLAALRATDEAVCTALLEAGANAAPLAHIPSSSSTSLASFSSLPSVGGELRAKLRLLMTDEGEPLDCPVCLEPIVVLSAEWTTCCVKGFHSHCLKGLDKCPMCRTRRRDGPRTLEPLHDAAVARSLQSVEGRRLVAETSGSRRLELATAALEMSFSGPQWMDAAGDGLSTEAAMGNSTMGSNYGWRAMSRGPV